MSVGAGLLNYDIHWENCGRADDPVQLYSLVLSPDTIEIPGKVRVSVNGSVTQEIKVISEVSIKVEKEILGEFWVTIPCVDHLYGSCTFKDICQMLEKITCPKELVKRGINCRCPLKKYHLEFAGSIPIPKIPHLPSGKYRVRVNAVSPQGHVMCYVVVASLKSDADEEEFEK